MEVTRVDVSSAQIALTRTEATALRNLLEQAGNLPFEARGPMEVFDHLVEEFSTLVEQMQSPSGPL